MPPESSTASAGEPDSRLIRAVVTVRGQAGYVFKSTDLVSYCFIPADCVCLTGPGQLGVDEIKYFLSGWCIRNARMGNTDADCAFLFPDAGQLITDLDASPVQQFLRRVSAQHPEPALLG